MAIGSNYCIGSVESRDRLWISFVQFRVNTNKAYWSNMLGKGVEAIRDHNENTKSSLIFNVIDKFTNIRLQVSTGFERILGCTAVPGPAERA